MEDAAAWEIVRHQFRRFLREEISAGSRSNKVELAGSLRFALGSTDDLLQREQAGDEHAREALLAGVAQLLRNGFEINTELRKWTADVLTGLIPMKSLQTDARDLQICLAVYKLEQLDIRPRRNVASRTSEHPMSGCAIVQQVLAEPEFGIHLSEGAIEQIWTRNAWRR